MMVTLMVNKFLEKKFSGTQGVTYLLISSKSIVIHLVGLFVWPKQENIYLLYTLLFPQMVTYEF